MPSIKKLLMDGVALTGTAIGPAVDLNETPFMGGAGRKSIVEMETAPGGAAVVKFQGHPGLASKATPASGDAGWYDIATFNASSKRSFEVDTPRWGRYNITTLGTGTGVMNLYGDK